MTYLRLRAGNTAIAPGAFTPSCNYHCLDVLFVPMAELYRSHKSHVKLIRAKNSYSVFISKTSFSLLSCQRETFEFFRNHSKKFHFINIGSIVLMNALLCQYAKQYDLSHNLHDTIMVQKIITYDFANIRTP